MDKNPYYLGFGDEFLVTTSKAQSMKDKTYVGLWKIKNFYSVKVTDKRMNSQATDWEKYVCKIHKEFLKQ